MIFRCTLTAPQAWWWFSAVGKSGLKYVLATLPTGVGDVDVVRLSALTPSTKIAMESWPRGRDILLEDAAAVAAGAKDRGLDKGDPDLLETVRVVLQEHPLPLYKAMEAVTPTEGEAIEEQTNTFFSRVASGDNRYVAQAWAEVYAAALPPREMSRACTSSFSLCIRNFPRRCLPGMTVLFAYGAEVAPDDLIELAKKLSLKDLKDIFLGGVACVDNPFIPGVSLSVGITQALKNAPEREKPILTTLQRDLDELLLEVLDGLPHTIKDVPGGLDGCEAVFEPEIAAVVRDRAFKGPLKLAIQEQQFSKTLCVSPLVFECMSHRFVGGLPSIHDTNNQLLRNRRSSIPRQRIFTGRIDISTESVSSMASSTRGGTGRDLLHTGGFKAGHPLGKLMQGLGWTGRGLKPTSDRTREWDKIFRGTVLPGAQFTLIGILTRPATYYKVPAMRMLLGFCVHLMILGLYTMVIIQDHHGALSEAEIVLTFHVGAEIVKNLVHIGANYPEYTKDKWHWFGGLSLSLLCGSMVIRIWDNDEHLGRSLFALSAPLEFARVLFFLQILPRPGLVIQMMGILFGEMLQFGLVLVTIMMGFTVSFFALFNEAETYGDVWMDVFKAMLGDFEALEHLYEGSAYRMVARIIVVVYLIIVAIMLLNLLIAVLSTEHAKVDEQQDRAFRASRVRIMKVHGRMVDSDTLPSPFNLLQLVLQLIFTVVDWIFNARTCPRVIRKFGIGTFWLMLGPPTLLTAWGLWVVSTPTAVRKVWQRASYTGKSVAIAVVDTLAVTVFHVLLIPFVAAGLWFYSGFSLLVSFKDVAKSLGCSTRDQLNQGDVGSHPQYLRRLGPVEGPAGGCDSTVNRDGNTLIGGGSGGGHVVDDEYRGDYRVGDRGSFSVAAAATATTTATSAAAAASVAKMLRERSARTKVIDGSVEAGGASVADIRAYLENPSTIANLSQGQHEHAQAATREHATRMHDKLGNTVEKRCDDLLEALAVVDANVRKLAAEVHTEGRGMAKITTTGELQGLSKGSSRLDESTLTEAKMVEIVERSVAPLRESLAALSHAARLEKRLPFS